MKKRKQIMNPTKLLTIVLCMMVCFTATMVFADDDFGIVSATPTVIKDPINPQPGMIFNAYARRELDKNNEDFLKESNTVVQSWSSLKTGVDKNEKFSIDIATGVSALTIRWEGFLKCKRAATYTFLFQKRERNIWNGYSVRINGKTAIPAACGEATCDSTLKVGWNKIEILCIFDEKTPLNVSFRPKGSLAEPRPIAPKDLFHDQKPEEDW